MEGSPGREFAEGSRSLRRRERGIVLGTVFVVLGILFLSQNAGLLPASISGELWRLWPLLIVIWGLILLRVRSWITALIAAAVIAAFVGAWWVAATHPTGGFLKNVYDFMSSSSSLNNANVRSSGISVPLEAGVKEAEVSIAYGAGEVTVRGGADPDLVSGTHRSNFARLTTGSETAGSTQRVSMTAEGSWNGTFGRMANALDLKLNENAPLSFLYKGGASKLDFNLEDVTADSVDVNAGASSIDLVLGDKSPHVAVKVDAGASSVSISVPRASGVRVTINSGLSSKNLSGFSKIDDHNYVTANYETAKNKIDMVLSLGASSVAISQY